MKEIPDTLAQLDLHGLSEVLAAHTPGLAELESGQWLGVVELFTMRLTSECDGLSADSWATCSAALTYALDSAVAAGAIDHREMVIRRLNLSAALLQRVPRRADVDILDPDRIIEIFFHEAPMTAGEARELAANWRGLDISIIRRLRFARSLAFPALLAVHAAVGPDVDARLKEWEDVLPSLP